jgi:hypothetical protein
MEGHKIESFEVIVDNGQGLIVERTIALRPYPAVKLCRDAMYASLKDKLPPAVWDYAARVVGRCASIQAWMSSMTSCLSTSASRSWKWPSYSFNVLSLEPALS